MQRLTDKEIRQALIQSLKRRANPPVATLEEVHVCNGNAIADVVAVYKSMHCYEIKGETDSIQRVVRQSQYYDQAFPLVSLVTTANHLRRAQAIIPPHWGILVANMRRDSSVAFSYVRGAARNPAYSPEISLLSLWRSELIKFPAMQELSVAKLSRQKLATEIVARSSKEAIKEVVGLTLAARTKRGIAEPYTQCEHKSSASGLSQESHFCRDDRQPVVV
jgi:hypothetical protein